MRSLNAAAKGITFYLLQFMHLSEQLWGFECQWWSPRCEMQYRNYLWTAKCSTFLPQLLDPCTPCSGSQCWWQPWRKEASLIASCSCKALAVVTITAPSRQSMGAFSAVQRTSVSTNTASFLGSHFPGTTALPSQNWSSEISWWSYKKDRAPHTPPGDMAARSLTV